MSQIRRNYLVVPR